MFPRLSRYIKGLFSIGNQNGTRTDFETDSDGNLIITTATDRTVIYTTPTWQDIDFPIIIRTTGPGVPTLTTINGNLTVPEWAVNDFNMCESQELIHMWVEGDRVYWHVHMTTNGSDIDDRFVRFSLEFAYCNVEGQWVFPAVVDSGDMLIPANTPDKTMKIISIHNLELSGIRIAGHCLAYLKRIASTGAAPTNDPWVPMLQLHVRCNTSGSRQIGTK